MVEAQTDPDMRQLVLEKIAQPRRDAAKAVINRAIKSGDLPDTADPEIIVDFLFGAIWFNLLLGDADFKLLARRIVNMIELPGSRRC